MGKNNKQNNAEAPRRKRKHLRAGALALLTVVGIGAMAGMAVFNANAKPNRDMQWYIREGAVQVAAPALTDAAGTAAKAQEKASSGPATAQANLPDADDASAAVIVRSLGDGSEEAALTETSADAPDEAIALTEASAGGPDEAAALTEASASGSDEAAVLTEAPADDPADAPTEAAMAGPVQAATEAPVKAKPTEAPASDGTVLLTITAVGDCTFGGQVGSKGSRNFKKCVEKFGYDYFFTNVRDLFMSDDLTIVNLEGPLTTVEKPKKKGEEFLFKGDPDYVKVLTGSGVELCNLCNNHTLDYGKEGLKETAKVLDDYGIGYCGYSKAYDAEIKGIRVRALGFTWWRYDKKEIVKAVKEAREGCDLLIVNIHWGDERVYTQDNKQTELGHAIIDAGADLVLGTHPHVYQGIESYKGKYIVYSLGNFCFSGNANPADKRCLIFQQTFSFNPGLGIAQANILDQGINIIPATISSRRDINDFQPTIMNAENGLAMLKAVASKSVNFDMTKARWTKDNYLLTYGLIQPEVKLDANGKPINTSVELPAESVDATAQPPEAEDISGADTTEAQAPDPDLADEALTDEELLEAELSEAEPSEAVAGEGEAPEDAGAI